MARVTQTATGKVFAIQGRALARGLDGKVRWLDVGDLVLRGETIVTSEDGYVQLVADSGPVAALSSLIQAMGRQAASLPQASDWRALSADTGLRVDPGASALQEGARVAALGDAGAPFAVGSGTASGLFALAAGSPGALAAGASEAAGGRGAAGTRFAATVDRAAPSVADTTATGVEDQDLSLRVGAANPGANVVQVHLVTVPTGGVLYTAAGRPLADDTVISAAEAQALRFVPAPNFHGDPGPVVYSVIDAQGRESAVARVKVQVQAVNDAPVAGTAPFGPEDAAVPDPSAHLIAGTADYRYQTAPGAAVAGRVMASDIDLDPLRFSATEAPTHGRVAVDADGHFVYTPAAGFTGADRFVVTVDDGRGGTSRSTVFIDVLTAPAAAASDASALAALAAPAHAADTADALTAAHGDAASAALAVSWSAGLVHSLGEAHADRGPANTAAGTGAVVGAATEFFADARASSAPADGVGPTGALVSTPAPATEPVTTSGSNAATDPANDAPTHAATHAAPATHAPFGFLTLQDIFHGRDAKLMFGSAESGDPSLLSAHRLPLDLGFGAADGLGGLGGLGEWTRAHPNG